MIQWDKVLCDRDELASHLLDEGEIEGDSPWYRNPNNSGYSPLCPECVAGRAHTDAEHDASLQ